MSTSSSPKTYEGNCHCRSIRYRVTLPEALHPDGNGKIMNCTCSICTKNGYLLIYPKREDVVFHNGSESRMKDYFFGNKTKPHRFCPECSSSVLIDFKDSVFEKERPYIAINARLLKGIDLKNAKYDHFDGANKLDPPYEA